MTANRFDIVPYLFEETKGARSRIDQEIASMNSNEALTVTYVGAIYAAFFQFKISDIWFLRMLSVLPIAISIYGLVRYNAQRHVINLHEAYIKIVEEKFRAMRPDFEGLMSCYDNKKESINMQDGRCGAHL